MSAQTADLEISVIVQRLGDSLSSLLRRYRRYPDTTTTTRLVCARVKALEDVVESLAQTYARGTAGNARGGQVMSRWRQQTFVPIFFPVVATVLMLASQANAQTALPLARVEGVWETTWAGGQAVLNLTQKDAAVTGTYSGTNEGKVKGTIAGNVLTGNWTGTANDSGGFALKFSFDGKSFTGTWGMSASKTDGGPWAGTRK
jgi:hypothetical protein